ncbi:hypothetical protein BDD41_1636 [Paracoccus versutus]|uniref:Uncharacterized protein n=1 Tax=Paracoccus versutus TaxID=34007 RepID=A0A3D9XRP1_PARVE|nr:hypothetical protein BDD41_1636 [Paracoccus versutus]SFY43216.1 hypothetical protein SAMN04244548_04627 [Paracoccus pantotrophus]
MADIDLNALSLAELKQLEKNVAKAIASFEDRRKAEARAAAETVAKQHGLSLSDLARYRLVALGSHRLAGPGKPAGREDEANLSFADEYDSYLIAAASQLRRGTPRDDVVAFLVDIETQYRGMGDNPSARPKAEAVVDAILADEGLWTWPDAPGRFGQEAR